MKSIKIGLLGCSVQCENLGCMALSYSLINKLEKIGVKRNIKFHYILFDYSATKEAVQEFAGSIGIDPVRIEGYRLLYFNTHSLIPLLRTMKNLKKNYTAFKKLKECLFVIDMTQGDSFSDIYGLERFFNWTGSKEFVERIGVPLVLGPQTYGPFKDKKVKKYAARVINRADLIISRDLESANCIKELCGRDVVVTTDVAFELPYNSDNVAAQSSKILVGINPSGLLASKKNDMSAFTTNLKVDYESYLHSIIEWLKDTGKYEIHMIPHVDNEAEYSFGGIDDVIYHKAFKSPVEAKNVISEMDIFIGSRMHATIAAFSSGVATIPVAYSRKFRGLFESIGYKRLVDLVSMETGDAVALTKEYIANHKQLREEGKTCMEIIKKKCDILDATINEELDRLL